MEIHERLERVFKDTFNNESLRLRDEMSSRDIPEWDSVNHINLMFAIESAFAIQFAGNQLAEFENIGELKKYLAGKTRI